MRKEVLLKKTGLNFTIGTGFIITNIFAQLILGAVLSIQLDHTLRDIGAGIRDLGQLKAELLIAAALSFIISGFLVYLWALLRRPISKLFGLERSQIPIIRAKKILALLITLFLVGAITSVAFYAYSEFIIGLSPQENLTSLGVLVDAAINYRIDLLFYSGIAVTIFGVIVGVLASVISPVQHKAEQITHNK